MTIATMLLRKFSVPAIALTLVSAAALGAPPPGADPNSELGKWFQGLRQPGTSVSCCSLADCRMTDHRAGKDGYEVLVGDRWVPVPPGSIVRTPNPTGRAIVCAAVVPLYHLPANITVLCFVAPEEG